MCNIHAHNRRSIFWTKDKMLMWMKCFTTEHIMHDFLLVDWFAEKLITDLEERKKIMERILREINKPGSTIFGEKKQNIKDFVTECQKRLQRAIDAIQSFMETNQLMQIMAKRKEYFELIKDTSTILTKLNKLSKVTRMKSQSIEETKDTDADGDTVMIMNNEEDTKTKEFVENGFSIVTEMREDSKEDINFRAGRRGRPPLNRDESESTGIDRALENELKRKSSLEQEDILEVLKNLSIDQNYLLIENDRKSNELSGFYLFDYKNSMIKATWTFKNNQEILLSAIYIKEINRAYFFIKKFTNHCKYIVYEYNVDSHSVKLVYLDRWKKIYWSSMLRCQNKLVLIQLNYQIVIIDLSNPDSPNIKTDVPPLTINHGYRSMFNILVIQDRYVYVLDTTIGSTKNLFAIDLISPESKWRSYNLGNIMVNWNKFACIPIMKNSKLLFFGEGRSKTEGDHTFILDLVSGELFKSYESNYQILEKDEFKDNKIYKVDETHSTYIVGSSHIHIFNDETTSFTVVKNWGNRF